MTQPQAQELDAASAAAFLNSTAIATTEGQSPLRTFEGDIDQIKVSVITGERGSFHKLTFVFSKMVVHKSMVPWPWPVGELSFNKSADNVSSSSAFGILLNSVKAIWGDGHSVGELAKHRVFIDFTSGHAARRLNQETKNWDDVEIEAYEILAIDGQRAEGVAVAGVAPTAGVSIESLLVEHANGKTQALFNTSALQDATVQSNSNVFSSLLSSSEAVLQELMTKNLLTKEGEGDQAVYHKVS